MVSANDRRKGIVAESSGARDPFPYPPIDPETEIRILELSSPDSIDLITGNSRGGGSRKPRLRGRFVIAKLASKPTYEALSYAWGEPIFDDEIELPEGILPITSHLGSALRHLRRKSGSRPLWIDAICINQSHESTEKGHQVSLMANIYRNTACCVIWLGSGSPMTFAVIDLLARLSKACSEHGIDAEQSFIQMDDFSKIFPQSLLSKCYMEARRTLRAAPQLAFHELLAHFLGQTYFQRLWVLQEMALPKDLIIIQGKRKLCGRDFTTGILVLNTLAVIDMDESLLWEVNLSMLLQANKGCHVRFVVQNREAQSHILALVAAHSERICKEPKDRVYALLGLQSGLSMKKLQITPDYTISDAAVFQQFAMMLLLQGDINFLRYAGMIKHTCTQCKMPSWVPDWACNQAQIGGRIDRYIADPESFKACDGFDSDISFDESDRTIIALQGIQLDFVHLDVLSRGQRTKEGVSNYLQSCQDEEEQFSAICLWNEICKSKFRDGSKYCTGEDIESVVSRTLVLNNCMGDPDLSKADLCPGAANGTVQCMRRLICRKQHMVPCEALECSMLPGPEIFENFMSCVRTYGGNRTLFITENGYIGLGPIALKLGDAIVFFYGAQTPYILRRIVPDQDEGGSSRSKMDDEDVPTERWQLIGDCYVHGFMDNEILGSQFEGHHRRFWIA